MNFNLKLFGKEIFSVGKSALSPDMAAWVRAEDVDVNGEGAKLVSPYSQSAWVYSAVSIIAQHVAQIPFRISRVGNSRAKKVRALRRSDDPRHKHFVWRELNEDIVQGGDVVDLFNRPHPTMSRKLFWEMLMTWMELRGEFFVLPLDDADHPVDLSMSNARVARMITLPTELFWHIVAGYELQAWRYTGSPLITPIPSEILMPSEVIHHRSPNPYLYWRGMSPLLVANLPAQTDYAGEQFQKGLWVNNADTGVIVTTDQILQEDQRKAIESALRERKRKAGTADRPLFLFGGAKIDKPTLTLMDMQFLETRKFLRQEIFSIFKVPEPLAGFTADLNDGGAGGSLDAVKASFIESTIGNKCADIEDALAPIIKTFGDDLIGWFDIDSLPIMQAARRARWDTAEKMFSLGVPLNDIVQNLDLGLPKYAWGETGYLPFNLQPAGETPTLPAEETPADGEKSNPFLRMQNLLRGISETPQVRKPDLELLWNSHITARRKTVGLFKGKISKVLNEFRGKTLAKLNEVHLEKSANRLGEIKSLVDLIFPASEFGKKLFGELSDPITSTLQNAGDELNQEIGSDDPWQMAPRSAKDYLASREQPIMGVGGTVRDRLNTSLQAGLDAGETTDLLADRVRDVFNGLTKYESTRVAQTEANTAYNHARHEAMQDAGIEYKSWLSSHGPHVRPAHAAAESIYIDAPIPVDQPFKVGGESLMYPGDGSLGASPGNVINCQCIQLAAMPKSEDGKTATYKIFGAGEMTFEKRKAESEEAEK